MRYTIKVEATLNGKTCKNPQIEFIQGEEFLFPCKIEGDQITLELRPGYNPNACIEGYIKCDDECLNCPPQYFKVCLCNDVTLLEPCQVCEDGFIKDLCTEADLLLGKICTPNGCQCPPNKPVVDPNTGQCVQCITGTTQGCKVCVGGSWEDIICAENERCENGGCECTEGYVRDPFTKLCIPTPTCTDDSECGECEFCSTTGCQTIVCPEGYKCYKGECIYWPCDSVSCANGADCGPDCGCVVFEGIKQCVPCHILECSGLCEQALGCKCNSQLKCEGVGDCGQYCDGSTPCLDENCTCYNNRCVKCSNFPCPDDCATHYNCGCNGAGDCEGGNGCNDNLTLTKKENCTLPTGCELLAEYDSKVGCKCEPIEFRINNTKVCNLSTPTSLLMELKVEAFKNNIPYTQWLDKLNFGDDELLETVLKTTITFEKKNASGVWVEEVVPAAEKVNDVLFNDNAATPIKIENKHIGFNTNTFVETNRRAKIVITAANNKITANNCINYETKDIATYTLDFTTASLYCTKINTYSTVLSTKVNDNLSVRIPLFVWSKSTTGVFENKKYENNGVYVQSGWFRKMYADKVGTKWTDKINKVTEGLFNNYNYKVTVDCGCKTNVANLQKVIFCCPKDFTYFLSNCGKTIKVKAFDTCDINKDITGLGAPTESQTVYFVTINGTEIELAEKGNLKFDFDYTDFDPIETILFEQRYKGTPLVAKACPVEYTETPNLPPLDLRKTCDPATVEIHQNTTGAQVSTVTGTKDEGTTSIPITYVKTGNKWVSSITGRKSSGIGFYDVFVTYVGGCTRRERVEVTCQPEVVATPTEVYAKAECPNGTNPDVIVLAKEGFTAAAEFKDPRPGGQWVAADTISPEIKKTFTNFSAGTYLFEVREGTKLASDEITILPTITPTITSTDICGTNAGTIKFEGGAPNSQWRITGPAPFNPQTVQLDSTGKLTVSIPSQSSAGTYFAALVTDASGATCPQTISVNINKGGGVVTPQIIYSQSEVCQGGEIAFRIVDGLTPGLTYNVGSFTNALIITDLDDNIVSTVTATSSGQFTHKIRPTLAGTYGLTLSLPQGSCYTLGSMTPNTILSKVAPTITNFSAVCSGFSQFQYDVSVTTTSSANTTVNVAGVALTNSVGNTWIGSDIFISQNTATATATNSVTGCTDTMTIVLSPCTGGPQACPPPQPVTISTVPVSPTCGSQNVSVMFNSTGLGVIEGLEYQWIEVIGGIDFALMSGTIDSGTPLPNVNGVPNLEVLSSNTARFFRLAIIANGICINNSDPIQVVASSNIEPIITGDLSVMTGVAYNYFTQDIPGATYVWTLTNANGNNLPVGTNSSSITISTFTPGNNTINVTVTNGTCSGSGMLVVNGNLNCPQTVVIQPVNGAIDNTCANLTYQINNGTSISSHRWIVGGVDYQTGGSSILNLDLSTLPAGSTPDITLEVLFASGCLITSNTYEYTRCSCLCNANSICNTTIGYSGANNTTTYTIPNADIYVKFNIGGFPDRLIIQDETGITTYLDTYQVGTNSSIGLYKIGTGGPTPYQSFDLDPANADAWQTGIAVGANIVNLRTATAATCNNLPTNVLGAATANDPTFFPIVLSGVSAIRGNDAGGEESILIKIPQATLVSTRLKVTGTPFQTESCSPVSAINAASYEISCDSFDPLLP